MTTPESNIVIKQSLNASVKQVDDRTQLTLEALADVENERVIDHKVVQTLVDSLDSKQPLPIPR